LLIIPAYNESARLGPVLERVFEAHLDAEILVVDDGSIDGTAAVAEGMRVTVVRHPFNLGYGASLQTGYKYALQVGATLVMQMDADGQHDPNELRKLTGPILAGECDIVVGSRFLEKTDYSMGLMRSLGRRLFRTVGRIAGLRISDPTSGLQAMNRRTLEVYRSDFFPTDYPDVDVLLAATRNGLRVAERSVQMSESTRASTLHGGLRSIYYVYKMLLSAWSAGSPNKNISRSSTGPSQGSSQGEGA
jgi:hypothetical protein